MSSSLWTDRHILYAAGVQSSLGIHPSHMSFTATVFRAMIASPSDVANERALARDVILDWNAVHSTDRGAVLLPVTWENNLAAEMGARPQAIINERLLRDCDLLIGVFWTRLGTPTGNASSGSVEEIAEHLKRGRPAMVYFSQAPVRPDSVDPDQWEALKKFKAECQQSGVYFEFDSPGTFRQLLTTQLAITMIRLTAGGSPSTAEPERERARLSPFVQRVPRVRGYSQAAKDLLVAASRSHDGALLRVDVVGGPVFQTGGKKLSDKPSPRETAKWDSALSELKQLGFIRQSGPKGEVFTVTASGYEEADGIVASDA